ncbi:TetR/AcrR family transcriptional regulator [Leucobacter coleopterorum]|uniref:TetR/AcrR family transcriptional regulator n=1 Tax=Leucobacter coleopterorum TaxID=2714933 RepID=A0ABX6JXU9_9MICO|nr:TetR family transcriptional regulator [Leucobacter coleopterorum]QIM17600.1 TetR/AcrR family transcriptional regulator [Leucobacter coleopterorum]
MAWDTERTRQLLLDAAVIEFAAHGPEGARINRVAATAGVNKERIYQYFGSKQKLFVAVLEAELAKLAEAVPLTPTQAMDLGDYAGQVYDYHLSYPHLLRLMSWEALQDPGTEIVAESERAAHYADKVAAVSAAQKQGAVVVDPAAAYLFSAVMAITTWWFTSPQLVSMIMAGTPEDTPANRRASLMQLVGRLVGASNTVR